MNWKENFKKYYPWFTDIWYYLIVIIAAILGIIFFT